MRRMSCFVSSSASLEVSRCLPALHQVGPVLLSHPGPVGKMVENSPSSQSISNSYCSQIFYWTKIFLWAFNWGILRGPGFDAESNDTSLFYLHNIHAQKIYEILIQYRYWYWYFLCHAEYFVSMPLMQSGIWKSQLFLNLALLRQKGGVPRQHDLFEQTPNRLK